MEIRVLKYFLAVAEERNITKAANKLHLTQPTLSRQIMDLEYELGVKLLNRKSHNIELTAEGQLFKKRAEEILDLVFKTSDEFSSLKDEIRGDIYIGSGETHAIKEVIEVIKDLNQNYPHIKFHFHSGNAEDLQERIDKGLLDFGIVIEPVNIEKYDYIPLKEKDVWGLIMRKDSPLAQKANISKDDLLDIPLIISRQLLKKNSDNNIFKAYFDTDLNKLNIIATYNLVYNATLLTEEGLGYTLTLDKLIDNMNTKLVFKPLSPKLESNLYLIYKKKQVFSPASSLFLNKLLHK